MKIISKQFTNRKRGDFEKLYLKKELMKKIVEDMRENAGGVLPINHWHLVEKDKNTDDLALPDGNIADLYDEEMTNRYSTAESMLDSWIGCKGMQTLSDEDIDKNKFFLDEIDKIGIWEHISRKGWDEYDYKARDMATIAEINMLYTYLEYTQSSEKYVLEVGGGYGRIAEALMNVAEGIKYVLIDAVPGSIIYSYEYLKVMLGNKKIGFYYFGDSFDLEQFDVYIIPAWHFEKLNLYQYDCCINISSMQEMGQNHVDYYLNLFDRVLKEDGIVFLENSHDYIFKGEWNFKDSWERKVMFNTPASWTDYFPIEIFVKREKDYSKWNQCVVAGYKYSLYEKQILNSRVNEMQNEIWRLQYVESELEKCKKENEKLKEKKGKNTWKILWRNIDRS